MLTPIPASEVNRARRRAVGAGMFFGLHHPDPRRQWQSAQQLYNGDDAEIVHMLRLVTSRMGGEPRVAASLCFQGYASRLLSPLIACVMLNGCMPKISAQQLYWRHGDTEMVTLAADSVEGVTGPPRELLDELISSTFSHHLDPLAEALHRQVSVAARLLHGNATAALISALRLVDSHSGLDWREMAKHALGHQRLRGGGWLRDGEPSFVRHSCCLYYRVSPGSMCGDCSLSHPPDPKK